MAGRSRRRWFPCGHVPLSMTGSLQGRPQKPRRSAWRTSSCSSESIGSAESCSSLASRSEGMRGLRAENGLQPERGRVPGDSLPEAGSPRRGRPAPRRPGETDVCCGTRWDAVGCGPAYMHLPLGRVRRPGDGLRLVGRRARVLLGLGRGLVLRPAREPPGGGGRGPRRAPPLRRTARVPAPPGPGGAARLHWDGGPAGPAGCGPVWAWCGTACPGPHSPPPGPAMASGAGTLVGGGAGWMGCSACMPGGAWGGPGGRLRARPGGGPMPGWPGWTGGPCIPGGPGICCPGIACPGIACWPGTPAGRYRLRRAPPAGQGTSLLAPVPPAAPSITCWPGVTCWPGTCWPMGGPAAVNCCPGWAAGGMLAGPWLGGDAAPSAGGEAARLLPG